MESGSVNRLMPLLPEALGAKPMRPGADGAHFRWQKTMWQTHFCSLGPWGALLKPRQWCFRHYTYKKKAWFYHPHTQITVNPEFWVLEHPFTAIINTFERITQGILTDSKENMEGKFISREETLKAKNKCYQFCGQPWVYRFQGNMGSGSAWLALCGLREVRHTGCVALHMDEDHCLAPMRSTQQDGTACFLHEGMFEKGELTLIPKCSVTPRPCSPRTPNERLSSRKILALYLYFNLT